MHGLVKPIDGKVFGYLTVLKHVGSDPQGQSLWLCKCVCGKEVPIGRNRLVREPGGIKSCGCRRWAGKHGHAKAGSSTLSTYDTWRHLIMRCTKETHPDYHNYGGRGIKVCQRWLDTFENFLADKGIKPNGLTLERIDNNGDYSPENTKWATYGEQLRNTRNTLMITREGKTMCLTDWAKYTGLGKQTIWGRIQAGWPAERLFEPSQRAKSTRQSPTPPIR